MRYKVELLAGYFCRGEISLLIRVIRQNPRNPFLRVIRHNPRNTFFTVIRQINVIQ